MDDVAASLAYRPLRSEWIAGWSYAARHPRATPGSPAYGTLTLALVGGGALEVLVPSWVPGLLSLTKSPGAFFHKFLKHRGVRSVPAPADPEPDLIPALVASIDLERCRHYHPGRGLALAAQLGECAERIAVCMEQGR